MNITPSQFVILLPLQDDTFATPFVMTDNSTVSERMEQASIKDKLPADSNSAEDFVDPWNVSSQSQTGIDYNKLISKFCEL